MWLLMLGADVYGYSNGVPTTPAMFNVLGLGNKIHYHEADICDKDEFDTFVQQVKPDFIFHLAAQAIVSTSYANPFGTVMTNVMGTSSVLNAIRNITWYCTCVLITSDKAYDNVEWLWGYRENDRLGGKDIYSGSKGAAELIIKSYWHSFIKDKSNIRLGVARAGNVIGGGDWAKDRIIVDCIKAFSSNQKVEIRSPQATRPWQHVLEPLSGYLNLAQCLYENRIPNGEVFNFGPRTELVKTVYELVKDLAERWGINEKDNIIITGNIPFREATLLKLNCDKALALLHWQAVLDYNQNVDLIADWYKAFYEVNGVDMYGLTQSQIIFYVEMAQKKGLIWSRL